jgi:hypothetical protein
MKGESMAARRTDRSGGTFLGGFVALAAVATLFLAPAAARAAEPLGLPAYLSDRGDGITTSLFGTYIREKEFLFYPFYEYVYTGEFEYEPDELGVTGNQEFSSGKLVEHEFLLFFAYGISDSLAVELESAVYSSADFTKDPNDNTAVRNIRESGLGDTETNIRWRYRKETESWPEITFFFQTVFPLQKKKKLLGTQHWEFVPGIVVTKGYSFGTLAARLSAEYETGEDKAELDEWAIDYVKRLSPLWRIVLSVEGDQLDEVSLIGEVQYTLSKNAVLKVNSGFGLVEKAPDVAPEIGVLFSF